MKTLAVIPARYASTRFPGKPLIQIGGRAMILRVCDRLSLCRNLSRFVVATDDQRIEKVVQDAGFEVIQTRSDHQSGTDRMVEVAKKSQEDLVLNVQGDEPFIDPETLDGLISGFQERGGSCVAATLATPIVSSEDALNPNVVKVVLDHSSRAMYFSRSPIPYARGISLDDRAYWSTLLRHLGVYLFRREFLLEFSGLTPSSLEELEKLEQLRILQNGHSMWVKIVSEAGLGIDVPEDLILAEKYLAQQIA